MHQNISWRGHTDGTKNNSGIGKSGLTNSGSLLELLYHKVEGGDKILEN